MQKGAFTLNLLVNNLETAWFCSFSNVQSDRFATMSKDGGLNIFRLRNQN